MRPMTDNQNERERYIRRMRILLETAVLSVVAVVVYLLLRHTVMPQTLAAHSDLIACAILLSWTWPVYRLICRHRAQAKGSSQNPKESELQMLRTVIDSLPDLIYFKDTQSRFLLANPAQSEFISGDSEKDVIGLTDAAFFPEENAATFIRDEQEIIRTGVPVVSQAERMHDAAGNEVWILTTKVPFRDKDGSVKGIIGIGRNVTCTESRLRLS